MKLSIIVPAHNERKRIPPMLEAYLAHFNPRYGEDVEYIIVVNGSVDGTEDLIHAYVKSHHQVKLVVIPDRIGKGGALMRGFHEAQGALTGFVDADGSTPPAAFQDMIDRIGEAGAIIASRWMEGAVIGEKQPLRRRMMSRIFNRIIRIMFGLRIHDTQCGAKLLRRDVAEKVVPKLSAMHWAFDVDLLFQIQRAGFRILEIPTTWNDVEGSKVHAVRSSVDMLLAVIRLRLLYSPLSGLIRWLDKRVGRSIYHRHIMQGRMIQQRELKDLNSDRDD